MFPLLLLIPGAIILWSLAQRHAERKLEERTGYRDPRNYASWDYPQRSASSAESSLATYRGPISALRPRVRPQRTAADYLHHLYQATMAARILDTMKPYAMSGDVNALMQSPPEVAQALAVLASPLDVSFAQKDLNVLGASPSLVENGVMDTSTAEAIKAIQTRFGQPVTGTIDPATAVAIRYSVGCINAQDRAAVGV